MSDTILSVQNLVGGYGKMTILNGTTFRRAAGHDHHHHRPQRRRQVDGVQGDLRPVEAARGQDQLCGPRRHELEPARAAQCRHLLRAAGPQHLSRAVGPPQYRARRRRAPARASTCRARIEAALDLFPALRRKSTQQASTLSGGEQKQLEIARALLLEPKLVLIDEPSIGLSPLMVQQTFDILKRLRDRGVTILMIEQNARSALEISDFGIVLELGQTRMFDGAKRILNDPRIGQLFLGGAMEDNAA